MALAHRSSCIGPVVRHSWNLHRQGLSPSPAMCLQLGTTVVLGLRSPCSLCALLLDVAGNWASDVAGSKAAHSTINERYAELPAPLEPSATRTATGSRSEIPCYTLLMLCALLTCTYKHTPVYAGAWHKGWCAASVLGCMHSMPGAWQAGQSRSTTVLCVRKGDEASGLHVLAIRALYACFATSAQAFPVPQVVIMADGQVTKGSEIVKPNVRHQLSC